MKSLSILTFCLLVPVVYAQERTAAGNLATEASWSALKSLADQANNNAKSAHIRLNKTEECAEKGMLYAPHAEDAEQGCKPLSSIPANAVMAFHQNTCPAGWNEYTPARGRFLRGMDNGSGNDPGGNRIAGQLQDDAFQGHWHNAYDVNGTAGVKGGSYVNVKFRFSRMETDVVRDPISNGRHGTPRTAAETRPKNVAVLFCRKD